MASFIKKFIYTIGNNNISLLNKTSIIPNNYKQSCIKLMTTNRLSSTHSQISKNIELISNSSKNDRILIMFCWLGSRKKEIDKYTNLYRGIGNFDIVTVKASPWQIMWPNSTKGSQSVTKDLLKFLDKRTNYEQILVHGFSVGGYLWGELLQHINSDREKYNYLVDKIVGQVWDSVVDVNEITIGLPKAVFFNNSFMEKLLQKYMEFHMKTFYKQATQYYIRASQFFLSNPVNAPALFLVSNADLIGSVSSTLRARNSWNSIGIPCYVHCFEDSHHVGHFRLYPKIYHQEICNFLEKLNLVNEEKNISSIKN